MAYTKTAWENDNPQTPVNAANLNKIEQGVEDAHTLAEQGGLSWRTISVDPAAPIAAAARDAIFVAFDGTSDVTMFATPDSHSVLRVCAAGFGFDTNPCTFNRNGKKIMGLDEDFIFDAANGSIEFAFSGDTFGWVIVSKSV